MFSHGISKFLATATLAGVLGLCGCGGPSSVPAPQELGELSDEDRDAVLEQNVCPVSGNVLGQTRAPIKASIDGQDIFVCSEECKAALQEEKEQVLSRLNE